ncbi:MAG: glycoside hydrolase family 3 C-terminal domain-containing protein, partial [Bacteroidota bacterium]|nr:glycoside hydrolase family 3 C-terminal domain-containing protein [Bacteroidota bacterium]
DSYPIHLNERILDEIYFPPFLAAIQRGGSRSIMTAYNSVDGSPASANDWLLNKKLKDDWHFKGFVISDASAVGGANVLHYTAKDYPDAGKKSITNGLDVIFQTAYDHYTLFIPPFLNGEIAPSRIDDAVSRVLTAKFELGLFEHPYVSESLATEWAHNSQHKSLAREAAVKSMVLLKNENNQLPLSKDIHSIAIIGEDAREARLGGYSGTGNGLVSILQGIQEKLGKKVTISFVKGPGREEKLWQVIPVDNLHTIMDGHSVKGLAAAYFTDLDMKDAPVMKRVDPVIDFNWTLYAPHPKLSSDQYAVRWEGQMEAPATGDYSVGVDGNDGYQLFINGKRVIDQWEKQSYHTRLIPVHFEKGKSYDIKLLFYETAGNAHIRLIWNYGLPDDAEKNIQAAVKAAGTADAVLVVAGIREGEFQDRASLDLPGKQEELIQRLAATGKPVTVILVGGSAITMHNWIDKAAAILDVWYPGEEGGHAIADVLFGEANPSGKLPITFPQSAAQLPLVYDHKPTGRGDDYNNLSGLPLFPFGFGLSYTHFTYSGIHLDKPVIRIGESASVSCKITNDGKRDGEEVVQLYIRDEL